MDDSGPRENGRHKADQYKSVHTQWMIPQHQMDNHAIKLMAVMAERDTAIQERNIALAEKKAALAERDMATLRRDAAIAERNTAIMERDNAIAALEYARENGLNGGSVPRCPPGCTAPYGTQHIHHYQNHRQQHHVPVLPGPSPPQLANDPYNHARGMHVVEAYPVSTASEGVVKARKVKRQRKESNGQLIHTRATAAAPRKTKSMKSKRGSCGDDLNKQATYVKPLNEWRGELGGSAADLKKQGTKHHNEWKDQDLGLNQVAFDETTMPVPVCSCTRKYQPCYKWGNGGWQSACCTTTMSMYPLPVMPNKRHARVGGRKMSGSAFTKLLSRLAAEGHDLSVAVDLKDHWAKHGTNRYITIR